MPTSALGWLLVLLAWIPVYEGLRALALRGVQRRLRGSALRFVRRHQVRLDNARFIDRLWLREALLGDAEVEAASGKAAVDRGVPLAEIQQRVSAWVQEIVPAFSLAAYYRFGAVVARLAVGFCFELVFDRQRFERMRARVPKDAIIVYVMNHRSNADYVVLSVGLLRHVALSYAVGEWARVWPLDVLFRSFGSFFVRRGEQDRLYHKVLERYVQILLKNGGTTGFFIEGKLSRNGALLVPKAGLLDSIIGVRRAAPDQEIAFLPIGLNYDHVLEDRSLVRERRDAAPPGLIDKALSLGRILVRLPVLIGANAVKVALRAHRKFGYAAVNAGEPLLYSAWEARHLAAEPAAGPLATLPDAERRPRIKALAADLLQVVGRAVPATPVPILAAALLCAEARDRHAVCGQVRMLLADLRRVGAPVALGAAFQAPREAASALDAMEEEVSALEEAELLVTLAGHALARRGLIRHVGGQLQPVPENADLLAYYARSVQQHLNRAF